MKPINWVSFGESVQSFRDGMSMREAAAAIGVAPATLCRIENGMEPSIGSFVRVCWWMKIDAGLVLGFPRETRADIIRELREVLDRVARGAA
jgi:transcriptional regulator with XRE-family HTH domain